MTVAEQTGTTWRWQRTLRAPDTLDDDLGMVGQWRGRGAVLTDRDRCKTEDYALRRLLVAWRDSGALRFPVEVKSSMSVKDRPDFVLTWPDGSLHSVAVVEAAKGSFRGWLSEAEPEFPHKRHYFVLREDLLGDVVGSLHDAIDKKVAMLERGGYRHLESCQLLIYVDTSWGDVPDESKILGTLPAPDDFRVPFRKVHIVIGGTVLVDVFGQRKTVNVAHDYEIDFVRWLFAQAEHLRRGAFDRLDVSYLAEELESLGRSDKRALGSQVSRLLLHLLKWKFQPGSRGRSWQASIDDARIKIERLLTDSPSLGALLQSGEFLDEEYGRARKAAIRDTELEPDVFPEACPYTAEQLVDPEFMPD